MNTAGTLDRVRRLPAAVFVAMFALPACDGTTGGSSQPPDAAPPPLAAPLDPSTVSFDTATLTFVTSTDSVHMHVDVADRADRRSYGLMDRDELDPDAGMIFLYDQPQHEQSGFWMYRTRIPLDIAYFDGAGRILAIRQMMPCTSLDAAACPVHAAGVPYFGAVEANRGYFARNDIDAGDRVLLPGRIGG